MVGSSPAQTSGVQTTVSQIATLVTITEAHASASEALATVTEAPTKVNVTMITSTWLASSSTSVPTVGESSIGPGSWLKRTSPKGDYLLGGIPSTDLEYMRKSLSPTVVHRDMMH